ncbi:hypothetical protein DM46_1441 [Burkholderia mallei]|nr:hypothetical protein DM46_1441 [Burkholderia mallei]
MTPRPFADAAMTPMRAGSAGAHLDSPGLGFVAARNRQLQHAVAQLRVDAGNVEVRAQRKRARVAGMANLGVPQPQSGGRRHDGFGLDGQIAVLHAHVELFARNAGQVRVQRDAVAILENVHRRRRARLRSRGLRVRRRCDGRAGRLVSGCQFSPVAHDGPPWFVERVRPLIAYGTARRRHCTEITRGFDASDLPTRIVRQPFA